MAWTAPATWVANNILTAAQLNQQLRDNLLETAPGKATAAGRLFVSTAANAIAERVPTTTTVVTSETTTSTTYTDLTTPGPAVTVTTGTSALLWLSCEIANNTSGNTGWAGYAVSGATTTAATDATAVRYRAAAAAAANRSGVGQMETLTAGSNTFTAKYRVDATTGTFARRSLTVVPL